MTEKISEQSIRKKKIDVLKERLNRQIEEKINRILAKFRTTQLKAGDDEVKVLSLRLHNLFVLQEFLGLEDTFNNAVAVCSEKDRITYQLDIDTIDWMLSEEFLLNHILKSIEISGECAEIVLGDSFFQHEVCTVLDKTFWNSKKEKRDEQ